MTQYTAKDLSQKLSDNILTVLRHLLPRGKQKASRYIAGSTKGEPGDSLSVPIAGDLKGRWCDFATGESGDLLDLWASNRSITLPEAMKEVAGYLGISQTILKPQRSNKYVRPKLTETTAAAADKVLNYLRRERKLDAGTLATYGVLSDGDVILFPYYRNKELMMIKHLKLERTAEGKKQSWVSKDAEPCLFGWQAASGKSRKLCLTEGEIDAMTLYHYDIGMDVMSVPFGGGAAGKHQWIESEFDNLIIYDEIYLCFDDDEEGKTAAKDVSERLGSHRCRIVTLPYKDANECLQKDVATVFIKECFDNAKHIDPRELRRMGDYIEQVKKNINDPSQEDLGYSLPWTKALNTIRFRPGELTVWTGINGHGKSQLISYLVLNQIAQGANICIASFEMRPDKTAERMARQVSSVEKPSNEHLDIIRSWWGDKLWVFDLVGTAKTERIIEVFKYARQKYGMDVFVVDSLMKCGIEEDDYVGQKRFLDVLCDFKNEFNCHIHVVTHPRKQESENTQPGKLDVKGTGAITDIADNFLSVWRNRPKEDKINISRERNLRVQPEDLEQPDCHFKCMKQRFGDWEGLILLWFDRESYQYLPSKDAKPSPMIALP